MTCFIGHMRKKGIFAEMGIEVGKGDAKQTQEKISAIVGLPGAGCPLVWKEVKNWLADPVKKRKLIEGLREP